MDAPSFFALMSNETPKNAASTVEALLLEFPEQDVGKPVLINLDSSANFRTRTGKASREEPVLRYGDMLGDTAVPYLRASAAEGFFEEAVKTRNAHLSRGRSFICNLREPVQPELLQLFDALCCVVTLDPSSKAFVYSLLKPLQTAARNIPVRIIVSGEPRLERCAGFFADLVEQIDSVARGPTELSFAGHVAPDPEETELAAGYGLFAAVAFPNSALRGQAKSAAKRAFFVDHSESSLDTEERLRRLSSLVASSRG